MYVEKFDRSLVPDFDDAQKRVGLWLQAYGGAGGAGATQISEGNDAGGPGGRGGDGGNSVSIMHNCAYQNV